MSGLVALIREMYVQQELLRLVVGPSNMVAKNVAGSEEEIFAATVTASTNRVVGVVKR